MDILLLDRDGTIIENVPYLNNPDEVKVIEDCVEPIKRIQDHGWRISVVSNQSGIGRKLMTIGQFQDVNAKVRSLFSYHGIMIDHFYFCPHAPWQVCRCRKPKTRLIDKLIERYHRESNESIDRVVMIGDSESDVDAAINAGVEGIMVKS